MATARRNAHVATSHVVTSADTGAGEHSRSVAHREPTALLLDDDMQRSAREWG